MTRTSEHEGSTLLERFFSAPDEMDPDTFAALLTDDVHWEHYNRFRGKGAEPLPQSVRDIQVTLPDRRFGAVTGWAVNGDTVHAEHGWTATPAEPDKTWGWKAGVITSMDCVSVFVVEGGRVKEWSDHG